MEKILVKLIFGVFLVLLLVDEGRTDSCTSETFSPGSYRKVIIIGKCKPGARILSEKQILNPIKSYLDQTLNAFFKFNNIGYVQITCVHLIVTTDTDEVQYKVFGGGIGRDFINFSVSGQNANVMMSRAIVYGI